MLKLTFGTHAVYAILLAGALSLLSGLATAQNAQAAAIVELAREAMTKYDLKAVIVRVTVDGKEVVTEALGESMTGVRRLITRRRRVLKRTQ